MQKHMQDREAVELWGVLLTQQPFNLRPQLALKTGRENSGNSPPTATCEQTSVSMCLRILQVTYCFFH